MKFNFKTSVLPLVLLTVLQTACVDTDPETKRLKAEQDCQIRNDKEYGFGFRDFLDAKKLIHRQIVNGKILKEQTITINSTNRSSKGFGLHLSLMDSKNQNYYQTIVDDRYLFILSEIKIKAGHMGPKLIICEIKELKVNGKKYSGDEARVLYKKDAIILPVANSKK